jgi:hypothetical protein
MTRYGLEAYFDKVALAQCRIGFQPVSPGPPDAPWRIRSLSPHDIGMGKGVLWARRQGDAYPTLRRRGGLRGWADRALFSARYSTAQR